MIALLCRLSLAGSLDNPEVGGPWGSPGSTLPTALWWNPAGIASRGGHQLFAEAAPTFATFQLERSDPHGGSDSYASSGVVPFLGLTSDLGLPGLGVGAGMAVPTLRGGAETSGPGAGRYHMMEAQITAAHFIFAGAYEYKDLVAIGLSAQAVASGWSAVLDNDTMPLLHDQINALGETSPYTDEDLEDPRYAARLSFPDLQARSFTWSAGLRAQPHPRLAFSLAHIAGYSLDQRGEMSIAMLCPPDTDAIGRFGAEKYELCDASFEGEGSVSYEVPARWHLAITGQPIDPVQIELFYTRVGWSAFEDFHIQIDQIAEQNQFESEFARENTPPLLEQDRLWARENQDAWTAGLDLKGQVHSRLRLGGRATWDRAAVPDEALSPNNYDADTLILNGNAMVQLIRPLQLGLSFSHYRVSERQVDSSAFRMAIEPEERAEDRWDYPHANGLYSTQINRVGIALLGQLGAGGSGTEGRQRAGEEPE